MPRPPSRTAPAATLSTTPLAPLEDVAIWPGHDVELADGQRLFVRPTGAAGGEPALFVHGLGGSAHNWTDLAGLLRDRLAIESLDLPGHGRSGPAPHGDYSQAALVRTVIAYLEQSGRGPVHLVGNSMGGAISIVVAARRPDLVRTLTVVSPAVPDNRVRIYPLRNDPRVAALVVPWLGEQLMRYVNRRYAPAARVKSTIRLCFGDRTRYPQVRLDEAIAEARDRLDLPWADAALVRSLRGLVTSQLLRGRRGWATLRHVQAPTLVLWGDTDRLVAPDLAPYVAAAIPDSRLLVLEGVGHTAMMENPVTTARALLGLLDDVTARTGPSNEGRAN